MTEPTRPISAPVSPPVAERSAWADIAKGACIVLVVLWHVVAKHYLRIHWQPQTPIPGAWGTFGESLLPLRMPVFFTVSGMFAVSAVRSSRHAPVRDKAIRFGYLYALWVLIDTVLLSLTPRFPTERADGLVGVLAELTVTPTNLWYLQALALYFVVARAAHRFRRYLPVPALLAAAALLSVVASAGLFPGADRVLAGNRVDVLQNLLFFLGGLHLRPVIERFAAGADRGRLLGTGSGFAVAVLAVGAADRLGAGEPLAWPLVWPACGVLATAFAVTAAAQAARSPWSARLARLGRQTLPVYLLHIPVLAVLDLLLAGPVAQASGPVGVLLAGLEPVAITGLVVAACLVLHRGLLAVNADWLFSRPIRHPADPASARRATGPALAPG